MMRGLNFPVVAAEAASTRPNGRGAGATVLLTGLPSAGKSTIGYALAARLSEQGRSVEVLDGDEYRNLLSPDWASAVRTGTSTSSASVSSPKFSPGTAS